MPAAAKENKINQNKFAVLLLVLSIIGLAASFVLTLEKIQLLKNPNAELSCNVNSVVSCGNVITSPQAEAFGFANPIIGLISFSVIITIAMGIFAGAKYRRWFWLGLEFGSIFGVLFSMWLFYQAVYDIRALCPYCMVVWSVVIPIFVYTTRYNLIEGNIRASKTVEGIAKWFNNNALLIVALWYLAIFLAILNQFWYYWKTLV